MHLVHFVSTDQLISHLESELPQLKDPFLESRYTGLLAVSAVTGLELAVKQVVRNFSHKKHKVLGTYVDAKLERLNGKIRYNDLIDNFVKPFGAKYTERFKKRIARREAEILSEMQTSMLQGYNNLILWRHGFVHEGVFPANATYSEVKLNYSLGKEILACLEASMRR